MWIFLKHLNLEDDSLIEARPTQMCVLQKVPFGGLSECERAYYGLNDCKNTPQSFEAAARRQTVIREPLHLALTKRRSPVQPLDKNKRLNAAGLKWVGQQHQRTCVLKINDGPITDTLGCFRNH